jgi:hypothetical protein
MIRYVTNNIILIKYFTARLLLLHQSVRKLDIFFVTLYIIIYICNLSFLVSYIIILLIICVKSRPKKKLHNDLPNYIYMYILKKKCNIDFKKTISVSQSINVI